MGFLHTEGQIILDGNGKEVILCGYGIGNWLDVEGFMTGTCEFSTDMKPFQRAGVMDRGRSISNIIRELCGEKYEKTFWDRWQENYFSEEDIRYLAEQGFNSVRLALNARLFLEEEPGIIWNEKMFECLKQRVDWCEQYGLYVILDLHAAVGGQSTVSCDDGVDNQPHLFTDEESWERSVLLWEELARRYADRTIVAGYELLNEPLSIPWFDAHLPELVQFYEECIERIRAIDRNHIIFLQGHRFAGRFEIFDRDYDPICHNWSICVHCYETLPDLGLLGPILKVREERNVPVWLGETGGYKPWMTVFYEMLREYHIGINIWSEKAVKDCDAAHLLEFDMPEEWQMVLDYAEKGSAKPSFTHAISIFDAFLENIRFENCYQLNDRCRAVLRVPDVTIPAVGYDVLPGKEASFAGNWPYCCFCGYRREDGMHIVEEKDYVPYDKGWLAMIGGPVEKYGDWPHLELQLDEGDFSCYHIYGIKKDTQVEISYRTPGTAAKLKIWQDDNLICESSVKETETLSCLRADALTESEVSVLKIQCEQGHIVLKDIRIA